VNVVETVAGMDSARAALSGAVGLVPTMGALHDGHLSLVRKARADSDHVVVSVFVNPTQFGPQEDLQTYPRDMHRDLRLLEAEGVDIVFAPSTGEMYPPGFDEWVEVRGPLTATLEGAFRPQFFRGVTTVVARLLRIVQPHRAYFGEKDAQQLRVISKMVKDLAFDLEIVPCPTVREPDGLAMSSRNAYLDPEQRKAATVLFRSLSLAKQKFAATDSPRGRRSRDRSRTSGLSVNAITDAVRNRKITWPRGRASRNATTTSTGRPTSWIQRGIRIVGPEGTLMMGS